MTLEEVAKQGNKAAMDLCRSLSEQFGAGAEYKCAVGSAATAFLFHAFRLELPKSKEKAVELLTVLLDDLGANLKEMNGIQLNVTVTAK